MTAFLKIVKIAAGLLLIAIVLLLIAFGMVTSGFCGIGVVGPREPTPVFIPTPTIEKPAQPDPAGDTHWTPQWSPDGKHIVANFREGTSDLDLGVYMVDSEGNSLQRILGEPNGRQKVLSSMAPDGRLAYLSYELDEDVLYGASWKDPHFEIADSDGSGVQVVDEGKSFGRPVWSPDGEFIAYFSGRYLLEVRNQGGGLIKQSPTPRGRRGTYDVPVWSNDGQSIAGIWKRRMIWTDSIDAGRPTFIDEVPWASGQEIPAVLSSPAWSLDDDTIYYAKWERDKQATFLYAVDRNSENRKEIANLGNGLNVRHLHMSPAGDRLLIVSDDVPGLIYRDPEVRDQLYTVDVNGIDLTQITDGPNLTGSYLYPAWSANGERIAVYNYHPDAEVALYTIAPDGSDARVLIRRTVNGTLQPGQSSQP